MFNEYCEYCQYINVNNLNIAKGTMDLRVEYS